MKKSSFLFFLAGLLLTGTSCQQTNRSGAKLETLKDSASYAIGLQMGENIKQNLTQLPGGDSMNMDQISAGFTDVLTADTTKLTMANAEMAIRSYFQAQAETQAQSSLEEGNAFLENNKARDGVVTTESGLQYEIIRQGNGPKPKETDEVTVHYHGSLVDGTVFDSSYEREEPATFPVNGVIQGWVEGLQLMPVGSKYKFYIPSDLAYGERGNGNRIPPNSILIFEVELLEIGTE